MVFLELDSDNTSTAIRLHKIVSFLVASIAPHFDLLSAMKTPTGPDY